MKSTNITTPDLDPQNEKPSLGSKIAKYLLKHFVTVFFILLALGIFIWAKIEIHDINKNAEEKKIELTTSYEAKIDSIQVAQLQLTAKTFSWALRSELQRGNIEQVKLFFNDFIKEKKVSKLQYINADNSTIEISTNTKEIGNVENSVFSQANIPLTEQDSLSVKIATPIMGLNKKLGTLVIEASK